MTRNAYSRYFDPLAKIFFMDISPDDVSMMKSCYVYAQGSTDVEHDLKSHFTDKLTPFFQGDGGVEISQNRSGGGFVQRIAAAISQDKTDVVILYGGKGAGKSTFLRRLLYFDPPLDLQLYAFPIIVDFLHSPQDIAAITDFVWQDIVSALNYEKQLDAGIEELAKLFDDRYQIALKQDLAAFEQGSLDFNKERIKLLINWKKDLVYVAKRLQAYWKGQRKGAIIVFDNTDQLPPHLQDHCFLVAQNIAREMGCVTVISMREERYCRARTAGVLDAYPFASG